MSSAFSRREVLFGSVASLATGAIDPEALERLRKLWNGRQEEDEEFVMQEINGRPMVPFGTPMPQWASVRDERLGIPVSRDPGFINQFANDHITYQRDEDHHFRKKDFWKPPAMTWEERRGDCEDYAIVKRAMWLDNGGRDEDTLILVVWDKITRSWHAVLLIKHGSTWLVLDNLNPVGHKVLPVEEYRDVYRLHVAMNGRRTWVFGRHHET